MWAKDHGTQALEALAHFRAEVVDPSGARMRLVLTGDHHHDARYETSTGLQLVTAGGGGADTAPTHTEPESHA